MKGAKRQQALLECAKKEEPLLWYTTLIEDQLARPLAKAFEKKYPGLRVRISRSNSNGVIEKMLNEARADRIESDVWSASVVKPLKEADVIESYSFPTADGYPKSLKDPNGMWASSYLGVAAPAYNTKQVSAKKAPKTYKDLLDPRWKGRMGWSTSSGTTGWTGFVGHVLVSMGDKKGMDYLEQLANQNVAPLNVSGRQIVDQVVAGEYDIALQVSNHHAAISAATGAPVDWIPMEPLMVSPRPTGITKGASSPCAARLFVDYQLSKRGQKIFQAGDYLPAHPDVPASHPSLIPKHAGYEYTVMAPEFFDEHQEEWSTIIDDLFR